VDALQDVVDEAPAVHHYFSDGFNGYPGLIYTPGRCAVAPGKSQTLQEPDVQCGRRYEIMSPRQVVAAAPALLRRLPLRVGPVHIRLSAEQEKAPAPERAGASVLMGHSQEASREVVNCRPAMPKTSRASHRNACSRRSQRRSTGWLDRPHLCAWGSFRDAARPACTPPCPG